MLAMTPTISVGDITGDTGIFYIVFFNCLVFHRSATKQIKTQEQFHWVVSTMFRALHYQYRKYNFMT